MNWSSDHGRCINMKKHQHRSEYWQVISGKGLVYIESDLYELKPNESIFIPKGNLHRLENNGDEILTIIEIQIGNKILEDDIERLEDDFGRL